MTGLITDRERALMVARQGPGTGICLALADLEIYWEHHRANAPEVHELRMNIRIDPDTGDRMAAVQAVADWLGVPLRERYGVYLAQRRFGTGEDSVLLECHYTVDKNATHKMVREAHEARELAAAS